MNKRRKKEIEDEWKKVVEKKMSIEKRKEFKEAV